MKGNSNLNIKQLVHFSSLSKNTKTEIEISKLQSSIQSFIAKEFKREVMPSLMSLTKKRPNNKNNNNASTQIRSHSTSSMNDNSNSSSVNKNNINPYMANMIHNSLFSISKQLSLIQKYIKLNKTKRQDSIPNKGRGKKRFIISNSLTPHEYKNASRLVDYYDSFRQSAQERIDKIYKEEIVKKRQRKQLSSFSTQTPSMMNQSQSQLQMDLNWPMKRRSLPEESFIKISNVRLKPIMSRTLSHNLSNGIHKRSSSHSEKNVIDLNDLRGNK